MAESYTIERSRPHAIVTVEVHTRDFTNIGDVVSITLVSPHSQQRRTAKLNMDEAEQLVTALQYFMGLHR